MAGSSAGRDGGYFFDAKSFLSLLLVTVCAPRLGVTDVLSV